MTLTNNTYINKEMNSMLHFANKCFRNFTLPIFYLRAQRSEYKSAVVLYAGETWPTTVLREMFKGGVLRMFGPK